MGYEILDAGGDASVRATANSLEDVFVQTALGMYSMVTDTERVESAEVVKVEVGSHSLDSLLVAWLNELVFLLDTRGFVAVKIEVTSLDPEALSLVAILAGERLDSDKHINGLLIKAATFHDLRVEHTNGKWLTEVMFDI